MSLGQMISMPAPDSFARPLYDFAHWMDHVSIVATINRAQGKALPLYPIWPRPREWRQFLNWHQSLHDDMNRFLVVAPRFDFLVLDERDDAARNQWSFRNYQQHINIRKAINLVT